MTFLVKTRVKKSGIHGKGVFSLERIRKGSVIALLSVGVLITRENHVAELGRSSRIIKQTIVRLARDYFVYKKSLDNEDFINHSEKPTMLYHCGACFATRDIKPGEELTVDYRYFLAVDDNDNFYDKLSGKYIRGYTGRVALLKSARSLVKLLRA
ncbi:MAG: SET domain-containing protein [Candidatus Aenigmarchaeota archaeon]|nr:SET domain-containing protein [Candidatus Aenigmarchaeota archaeon]